MLATKLLVKNIVYWLKNVSSNITVSLKADSRQIQHGDIFFAYPGDKQDGRDYILDAKKRGASAIVYDAKDFFLCETKEIIPCLGVDNLKRVAGFIANIYYNCPDKLIFTVAVTGTNGKTSCAYWLGSILSRLENPCSFAAVIGTLGIGLFRHGELHSLDFTGYTTPDSIFLQNKIVDLFKIRVSALAIEASSIGLDQGRMNGLHVDVALFTNFTRDHLDYHGNMASYERAKMRLFDMPNLRYAVVNLDDRLGYQRILPYLKFIGVPIIGYTIKHIKYYDIPVLYAYAMRNTYTGISFSIKSPYGTGIINTQLLGQFNVSNILGVLGVLLIRGIDWNQALNFITLLTAIPGRMQKFGGTKEMPLVIVDYAHTPDALKKTLSTLKLLAKNRHGKLWCIFGCGGDRDLGKRPQMGKISETADYVVLTSDNPRYENPHAIVSHIRNGMRNITPYVLIDRAVAILSTVMWASKHDVILLAGKGYEMYQEINGQQSYFLDESHVISALARRVSMF